MDWNFTLTTTASGMIDGSVPFDNERVHVELSACRLVSHSNTDRHFAVFNGLGVVAIGDRRFAFDPNRYGLLIECERQASGDWVSASFGTVDAPLMLAGFDLPRWSGLQEIEKLHATQDSGMNCGNTLEALDSVTLEMATVQLERGTSTPTLMVRRIT
jgi:hypothetical protein